MAPGLHPPAFVADIALRHVNSSPNGEGRSQTSGARVAFDIPLRGGGSILMTDYASADCWDGSRIRTWIAQSGAFR